MKYINMRIRLIFILIPFIAVICRTTIANDTVKVILLAGQSNMEGSGMYDELSDIDKQRLETIAHRVLLSDKGNEPKPLSYTYSQYKKEKLGNGNVFGPELFMGITLAEANPNEQYLLVKLAQGGTSLYGAWNPLWDARKADYAENQEFKKSLKLYETHRGHIQENLERLDREGKPYKIAGMLWMQGENDAAKELSAKTYGENLRKLIDSYRNDLNVDEMPFVLGQINSTYGSFEQGPDMVREAQQQVVVNDPFADIVLTSTESDWRDFPKHPDNVHYNTEGQKRLGRAMGSKLMNLWATTPNEASAYIDDTGVVRWTGSDEELCIFGTNYAVPFSYWDWRAPLNYDTRKAIDEDVYHIARLGLDGYRIHVWEAYISDSMGNLNYNQHFELFDYLLFKLRERGIKMLITPMILGSKPNGFAKRFGGKSNCLADSNTYSIQQNYLQQFVSHVNPYTGIAYKDDPDIIAFEIVNEPHHGKAPEAVTPYINRMYDAIRTTGCTKPIFYNMTTSSDYIDGILASKAQGGTFQWYPSGLTCNHNLKGNMLPHVDKYHIPFEQELKKSKRPKFVYEFSPSDIGASGPVYPAMARSFREAGFQFAAYFAYDPLHAAYCNIEYRTHFMNLAYTPRKAIGLKIASEAFHTVPLYENYGRYPHNNKFESISLKPENDLAELLTEEKFLYSNSTETKPAFPEKLIEIAGTGNSPIVQYSGTGAFFLDKLDNGIWRLEVMPDVFWVEDPFFVPYIDNEVAVTVTRTQKMNITLPDLGKEFRIKGLNDGNLSDYHAEEHSVNIKPGVYLLTNDDVRTDLNSDSKWKNITLKEFVVPERRLETTYLLHKVPNRVNTGEGIKLTATVVSPNKPELVELVFLTKGGGKTIFMKAVDQYLFEAVVPAEFTNTEQLVRYHIQVKDSAGLLLYPEGERGGHILNRRIYSGDQLLDDKKPYQFTVVAKESPVCLFDAEIDWHNVVKMKRNDKLELLPSEIPNKSMLKLAVNNLEIQEHTFSMGFWCADRINNRKTSLPQKKELVVYAKALNDKPCKLHVNLLMKNGSAFSGLIDVEAKSAEYSIRLDKLKPDKSVLLPRSYPKFHRFWFEPAVDSEFRIEDVEKIQLSIGPGIAEKEYKQRHGVLIGWITLK